MGAPPSGKVSRMGKPSSSSSEESIIEGGGTPDGKTKSPRLGLGEEASGARPRPRPSDSLTCEARGSADEDPDAAEDDESE